MRAIRIHEPGGREVLRLEDVPAPDPGPGQVRIRVRAAGVNFIDVYHRTGLYPQKLPFTPGLEAAGVVDAVGPDVDDVRTGDRVACVSTGGAYAEFAIAPAAGLVPVPDGVELETAAAVLLQGMTAHYLTHSTYLLREGEWALVHAAAGGVGLLLTQMARKRGARVIGTVSTEEKAALAKGAGADHVVLYTRENFRDAARRVTGGAGVHVVYDSVGRDTFLESLASLRPRGCLVSFGQSSGAVGPIEPLALSRGGSLFLTRPTLAHYTATRQELLWRAGDVLGWLEAGELAVRVDRTLPLDEAAEAHRLLESRETAGKVLLAP